MIEFSPWPPEFADRYRAAGYWIDQPLTRILETQLVVDPTAEALIYGLIQLQNKIRRTSTIAR